MTDPHNVGINQERNRPPVWGKSNELESYSLKTFGCEDFLNPPRQPPGEG
jgi:hypothetical protein